LTRIEAVAISDLLLGAGLLYLLTSCLTGWAAVRWRVCLQAVIMSFVSLRRTCTAAVSRASRRPSPRRCLGTTDAVTRCQSWVNYNTTFGLTRLVSGDYSRLAGTP